MDTKLAFIGIGVGVVSVILAIYFGTLGGNEYPIPLIQKSPGPYFTNNPIEFSGSNSKDSDGEIISHVWDFGDGTKPISGEKIAHKYQKSGTYEFSLIVKDNDGAEVPISDKIVILDNGNPVMDKDKDGIEDSNDNCPTIYNPNQEDDNQNGIGNVCDLPKCEPNEELQNGICVKEKNGSGVFEPFSQECSSKGNDISALKSTIQERDYYRTAYDSAKVSPFIESGLRDESEYFCLEKFEDKTLNVDGVSTKDSVSVRTFLGKTNSVDGDGHPADIPDGNIHDGNSLYAENAIMFEFDEKILKRLPTYAGIVVIEGRSDLHSSVTVTAFDSNYDVIITSKSVAFPIRGGIVEDDQFIGLSSEKGIKAIQIKPSHWMHIDHLQYGWK